MSTPILIDRDEHLSAMSDANIPDRPTRDDYEGSLDDDFGMNIAGCQHTDTTVCERCGAVMRWGSGVAW